MIFVCYFKNNNDKIIKYYKNVHSEEKYKKKKIKKSKENN